MSELAKRLAAHERFEWRECMLRRLYAPGFEDDGASLGRVELSNRNDIEWGLCNRARCYPDLSDAATQGVLWAMLCEETGCMHEAWQRVAMGMGDYGDMVTIALIEVWNG